MKRCKKCNRQIGNQYIYCGTCRPKTEPRKCIRCGGPVKKKCLYCEPCKKIVNAESRAAQIELLGVAEYWISYVPIPDTSNDYLKKFKPYIDDEKRTGRSYGQQSAPVVEITKGAI